VDPRCIAELLAPFLQSPPGPPAALNGGQLEQVSAYLDLLLRWNARINLTAVRDPESIVTRHFGESFFREPSRVRARVYSCRHSSL
jgi:16S rRNA (guanine527-N7)-methyltransferase